MKGDSGKLAEAFDKYLPKDSLFMFFVLEKRADGSGRMTSISSVQGKEGRVKFLEEALKRERSK